MDQKFSVKVLVKISSQTNKQFKSYERKRGGDWKNLIEVFDLGVQMIYKSFYGKKCYFLFNGFILGHVSLT